MNLSPQLKAALTRAAIGALLAFAATTLTAVQAGQPLRTAAIAGAGAAVAYLVARGAAEGWYDQQRQASGNVQSSDVGQPVAAPKP